MESRLQRLAFVLVSLLSSFMLQAQLCTGSLGDPIVNITFGSGSNPGPPLTAAGTNYQYTTACPNDGFYTVANSKTGCYSWHGLTSDHTGDPGGYFMLVNASNQPSAFYVDTVDLLCSNTVYEFAAWVTNVNSLTECNGSPNQPNLTFRIESVTGTLLQSYNSGNIAPQNSINWKQYGFFFSTPANISKIVLRIVNNAPGGCGNDLALDDITFRPCGPLVNATANNTSTSITYCKGASVDPTLSGSTATPYPNSYVQWQVSTNNGTSWTDIPGAISFNYTPLLSSTAPGVYLYRIALSRLENAAAPQCRVYSNGVMITVSDLPSANASSNSPVCEKDNLQLTATGGADYQWSGPSGFNSTLAQPQLAGISMAGAGSYSVTVTNAAGCTKTAAVVVTVLSSPAVSVDDDEYSICEGDTVQLGSSGGGSYSWTPQTGLSNASINNPLAYPSDTANYLLTVTAANGCKATTTVKINVAGTPAAHAGPDKELITGGQVQLEGSIEGSGYSFSWAPPVYISSTTELKPTVSPPADTSYILTATSTIGCGKSSDTVFVKVFSGLFVPDAFSPNGDGRNDTWNIPGLGAYRNFDLRVFNRWGGLVFHTRDAVKGWDGRLNGKDLPTGVYPYLLNIVNGPRLKGWVLLIR